jgi:hypothetical protein
MGTYNVARISTGSLSFYQLIHNKKNATCINTCTKIGSPGHTVKKCSVKNIFTGNLISNSYLQGNIGEPIFMQVYQLGAFFSTDKSQ